MNIFNHSSSKKENVLMSMGVADVAIIRDG